MMSEKRSARGKKEKKDLESIDTHDHPFFLTGLPTTGSVLGIKMVTMTSRVAFAHNYV